VHVMTMVGKVLIKETHLSSRTRVPRAYLDACFPAFGLQMTRSPIGEEGTTQLADLLGFFLYFLRECV